MLLYNYGLLSFNTALFREVISSVLFCCEVLFCFVLFFNLRLWKLKYRPNDFHFKIGQFLFHTSANSASQPEILVSASFSYLHALMKSRWLANFFIEFLR